MANAPPGAPGQSSGTPGSRADFMGVFGGGGVTPPPDYFLELVKDVDLKMDKNFVFNVTFWLYMTPK